MCGCVKEAEYIPEGQNNLHEVVFHACWAPGTKTMLQEDGGVWWEPGDVAGLFFQYWTENEEEGWYQTPRVKLVSTNNEVASSTDFVANFINTGIQTLDGVSTFYAIYPYSDCNYFSSSNDGSLFLYFSIPTIQTAVAGSFDRNAFISYAETQDDNLFFRNLCGGVKFSVSQEGIKEVIFRYSSGEKMSGAFGVLYKRGENMSEWPSMWGGESDEVIVRAPDDSFFEVGKYYYAVMNPSENDSPLIVTYIKDDSKATYITSGPTSIKRSVFKRLYNKDKELTFVPYKNEAILTTMMKGVDLYNFREKVTEVYFHPCSDHITDYNLGSEDAPVYFEIDGTVLHYFTPKESFNVKNVSKRMFSEWRSLTKVDLSGVDVSESTDLSYFFSECYKLRSINLEGFDTSLACTMKGMFHGCKILEELDLSSFNTSHVVDMSSMFDQCRNLRDLNLGSFDTHCCIDMSWMFNYCVSLEKLDMANFDVSSVQDAFYMSHNMTIHRKHCLIRASDATRLLMCELDTDMPQAAKDYFITWITPGEEFPAIADPFADLYRSTDYSKNMTYSCIQEATKGKGIDFVIMGDAYSDRLINDGTYDRDLTNAVNQIFSEEPLKSLRDYFNIYITYAVSENETISGITALDLVFEDFSSHISGGDGIVDDYMRATLPNYGREFMMGRPQPFIILLANTNIHAGTCAWFSSGSSIVYTTLGVDEADFHATQCHEFGHAVGLLADEYDEHGYTFNDIQSFNQKSSDGWWPNVDVTSNPNTIKWSRFLHDDRYANQGIGVFEGGHEKFAYGIWRPTENSLMNSAATGFNAPCREAIYKRVHELADDSFVYDYETFVAFDQPSWANEPKMNCVVRTDDGCTIQKFSPPVFINGAYNPNGASTTIKNLNLTVQP